MPRKYQRKCNLRASWSEESLKLAIEQVRNKTISLREAERRYGVPARTIARRMTTGNTSKLSLGPTASLGVENEKQLACNIKRLIAAGFEATGDFIRTTAFQFAEELNIPHRFSREKQKAGYQWLQGFLERNRDITVSTDCTMFCKNCGSEDIGTKKNFKENNIIIKDGIMQSEMIEEEIVRTDQMADEDVIEANKIVKQEIIVEGIKNESNSEQVNKIKRDKVKIKEEPCIKNEVTEET